MTTPTTSSPGPLTVDFTKKRVVITGGTRGIGRAMAEAYLAAGATVVINGSTPASVKLALDTLPDEIIGIPASVADPAQCQQLIDVAVDRLGGLDLLVNNAGTGGGPIESIEPAAWESVVDTNLRGAFFCARFALPALRESGGGVLNVSSVYGIVGSPYGSAYSAAKGGLVNLTRSMAMELAPEVRVNCLCPGGVDTDMLRALAVRMAGSVEAGNDILKLDAPQRRIAAPPELCAEALWPTSDHATFVTGSIHTVDGAETGVVAAPTPSAASPDHRIVRAGSRAR